MNHLITTKQINVNKLDNLIDFSSSHKESVFSKVHIHVYHGEEMFSKFMFRANRYDNLSYPSIKERESIIYYCLNIALESRRKNSTDIYGMLKEIVKAKQS